MCFFWFKPQMWFSIEYKRIQEADPHNYEIVLGWVELSNLVWKMDGPRL